MEETKKEKIGEVNYNKFKTEFYLTSKVKEYLEEENVSLAMLLPRGWEWYEVELFDAIDANGNGKPDEKYGNEFEVIYFGIIEYNKERRNKNIEDNIEKETNKEVFEGQSEFGGSPKNQNKKFQIKYIVKMK